MKRLSHPLWILILWATAFGSNATAADPMSLEKTLAKTQFEKLITERIDEALRTTLKRGSYEVYVEATVAKKPTPVFEGAAAGALETEPIPPDLTLGVINAEPLIRLYAKRLAESRQKGGSSVALDQYEIRNLEISLGLVTEFPENYRAEMGLWLKRWASSNFGGNANTKVTTIREPPPKGDRSNPDSTTNDSAKEPEESWLDRISKIQGLVGAALIALVLLVTAVLFGVIASQNSRRHAEALAAASRAQAALGPSSGALSLPAAEDQAALQESPASSDDKNKGISDESVSVMRELKELRELNAKIGSLYEEIGPNLNHLVNVWMEAGQPGLYKLAALLDSHMEAAGRSRVPALPPIPESKRMELLEIFREMPNQSLTRKLGLIKDVYWDLMALKVLGHGSMRRPFAYLSSLSSTEIKGLIENQSPDVQALVVLNMPEEARNGFLKESDLDRKKQIIQHSLSLEEVDARDLEVLSETVKTTARGGGADSKKVSMLPLSMQLLHGLGAVDEIQILRDVVTSLSDRGGSLKRSYPSLAFLDEWSGESLSLFLERLQPDQVVVLLKQIPTAQDLVMAHLSPRMAEIVSDDLKLSTHMKPADVEKALQEVRSTLRSMVRTGVLNLERAFGSEGEEKLRAA